MKSSIFLLIFFGGLCPVYASSHFRICAFNLHNFGESKSKKTSVMLTLTRVRPPASPFREIVQVQTDLPRLV